MKLIAKNYEEGNYETFIQQLTKTHMQQYFIDNFGGWSDEVSEKRFFKILKNGFVKLFFLKNQFVGYVSFTCEANNASSYLIHDIHIVDNFQKKGYGKEILMYVLDTASRLHKTQLKVFVFKNNLANKFYRSRGFKEVDFLEKSNTFVMVKSLIE